MPIPDTVARLVEQFSEQSVQLRASAYKEARVRQDFIDPLFEALGWDIRNAQGLPQNQRDLVIEDRVWVRSEKDGTLVKAPDYGFYIGGIRKFFVEAKKPSVSIKNNADAAFQLQRYAWSAGLPVSILTDFEEFAVYDCRAEPSADDSAATGRIEFWHYTDYADKWATIEGLFSRNAVREGALEQYASPSTTRKGTAVDTAFLREISTWRDWLAQDLALHNPGLTPRDLNFAVQMIIDRIVFLRICEARGIEPDGRLRRLIDGDRIYRQLLDYFRQADVKYNSGLFHFSEEKGRAEGPDTLTPNLIVPNEHLRQIIRRLYYPDSPYAFDVIPVEILGQVYEQFLGKVIRLDAGGRAAVEEKPEVRKAGGVYYTPGYIVEYIVRQTLGPLLEGKTPKEAAALRILDPACGSGSFLIGAYQFLLDWHLSRYTHVEEDVRKHRKELVEVPADPNMNTPKSWRLATEERKRILLTNIYGVDIDTQAVEVTKFSLLLKVLEGLSLEQQQMSFERLLPDLSNNIKCGNSLIGLDFYTTTQTTFLDDEERYRVNAFDWRTEFPTIMQIGGFDAVIGNPPYIFTRNQGIDEPQKLYFYKNYMYQSQQLNTFGIFIERCRSLLRNNGYLGFITPNNWLTIDTFAPLRKFILENTSASKIVNIRDRVFAAANVDTAIILFKKGLPSWITIAELSDGKEVFSRQIQVSNIKPPAYIIQIALFRNPENIPFLERIESLSQPLAAFCTVSTGLKVYQIGKGKPPQTDYEKNNRVFHSDHKRDATYGPYLDGIDVRRHYLAWSGQYLSYGDWIAEPRKSVPFSGERLLIRQIPAKPPYLVHGVFTNEPFYNDINSMVVFSPIEHISLKYLLGLINSRLLSIWFLKKFDKLQRKIFPQFKVKELAVFPIRPVNFSDPPDTALHDQVVLLVERMLELHKQLLAARTPTDKRMIERQITATDQQIDYLVYELYQLTAEERALVEGGTL